MKLVDAYVKALTCTPYGIPTDWVVEQLNSPNAMEMASTVLLEGAVLECVQHYYYKNDKKFACKGALPSMCNGVLKELGIHNDYLKCIQCHKKCLQALNERRLKPK